MRMEQYQLRSGGVSLAKPRGWIVKEDKNESYTYVSIRDPQEVSRASALIMQNAPGCDDSLALAAQVLKQSIRKHPDLKIAWSKTTRDQKRTVTSVSFTNDKNVPVTGRYYFSHGSPRSIVFGYETRPQEFDRLQPLLLSLVLNVVSQGKGADNASAGGKRASRRQPTVLPMTKRQLSDGTAALLVPDGWSLKGEQGITVVESPDGAGFQFWLQNFVGQSTISYFDNRMIPGPRSPYLRPMDALFKCVALGGSQPLKILYRTPDPSARATMTAMNITGEAELGVLSFKDKQGRKGIGMASVISSRPAPSGQWYAMWLGVFATEDKIAHYYPTLEKMAKSFAVNQRWSEARVQAGLENLQKLKAKTLQIVGQVQRDILEGQQAAYEERSRSADYVRDKFSSYLRGEQKWVSEVEGGRIYTSDSYGLHSEGETISDRNAYKYWNYKGENPFYNEQMTPVDSTREVWDRTQGR
ncbi:MAG: hypothetical protein ACYTGW_14090 [Planctomycetota bacterium]